MAQSPARFKTSLGGDDEVNVIYDGRRGGRLDFGIPNLYRLPDGDVRELREWWEGLHDGAELLPSTQSTSGIAEVNAVYKAVISFVFHIPIKISKRVGGKVANS